jgi:hypothetical protein
MNTCRTCWFYEPIPGQPTGQCLADPPISFLVPAPPSVLQRPGVPPQPATMSIERITAATRKACRHYFEHKDKLDG